VICGLYDGVKISNFDEFWSIQVPRGVSRFFATFIVVVVIGGCVAPRKVPRYYDATNPLKRVAVLPMKNDTLDVDGPNIVRKKLVAALENKSYTVEDTRETDKILRDQMGINLGGQLDLTTPQKLGEVLCVDGVVYGTLMDFDETTTGLLDVKKVRAKFKLVNTMTGRTVWEGGLGVRTEVRMSGKSADVATLIARAADAKDKDVPWVTLESTATGEKNVGRSLAFGLGAQLFSKAVGIHLDHESAELVLRVTGNLPWGPGPSVPITALQPRVSIPVIKTPEIPSFGYMDWEGKTDFSAVIFSTVINKNKNDSVTMEIPIAIAGKNMRMDMDMSMMMKGAVQSPFGNIIIIEQGDKKVVYTLYTNSKRYLVRREPEWVGERPQIEKTKVGSEIIDNRQTDKFKVKVIYKNGMVEEGFIWNALDLNGMTIKSEIENKDNQVITELRNIILKAPDQSLFEIPEGYTEAKSSTDLMPVAPKNK
jgi:hypothetical protein